MVTKTKTVFNNISQLIYVAKLNLEGVWTQDLKKPNNHKSKLKSIFLLEYKNYSYNKICYLITEKNKKQIKNNTFILRVLRRAM